MGKTNKGLNVTKEWEKWHLENGTMGYGKQYLGSGIQETAKEKRGYRQGKISSKRMTGERKTENGKTNGAKG